MRKLIYIALLTLFSCEKAVIDTVTPDGDTSAVTAQQSTLVVNVLYLEQTPFVANTAPGRTPLCTRLNFVVYNMAGTRVKQVNQIAGNDEFGKATFSLPAGDYQLLVLAHSSDGNPTLTNPKKIQFKNAQGFTDTFLTIQNVTIGTGTGALEKAEKVKTVERGVMLRRAVSLCRFCVTDDYPDDVTKMRFYYTGGSGACDATTGWGCVNSKQEQTFQVGANNAGAGGTGSGGCVKQFDLYTFLHNVEGTIRLVVTALDVSDGEVLQREYMVPMRQRSITLISGGFFDGSDPSIRPPKEFVSTDWDGEVLVDF